MSWVSGEGDVDEKKEGVNNFKVSFFLTVDGKNPAPLRMPEMLVLSQYQDVFGHPKWCRIFSINRINECFPSPDVVTWCMNA